MTTTVEKAQKNRLPEGWQLVKLGDVCRIQSGGTPSRRRADYFGGSIPWAKIEDLTRSGMWIETTEEFITELGLKGSSARLFPPRTVLFAMYASIGAASINAVPLATNQAILGCQCSERLLPEYLWFWFAHVRQSLFKQGRGGTQANLNAGIVRDLELPLPSRETQQRLIAQLTEQMATLKRAQAAAEAQLEAAKRLFPAYATMLFDSEVAQSWPVTPLGSVGEVVSGITLGQKNKGQENRKIPYLRVANVKDGYLDLSEVKSIETKESEIAKLMLEYGDLLLTEGGDPDKLGRGTFWQKELPECIHQNHIFRVRFDLQSYSPEFLSAQIGSSYGKRYFLAHAKQTTGIATINQKVLKAFPLKIPPLAVQRDIVERLNGYERYSGHLVTSAQDQLDAIKALPATLLVNAFKGVF